MVSFPAKTQLFTPAYPRDAVLERNDEAVPLGSILPEVLRRYGLESTAGVDRETSLNRADERRRRLAATRIAS